MLKRTIKTLMALVAFLPLVAFAQVSSPNWWVPSSTLSGTTLKPINPAFSLTIPQLGAGTFCVHSVNGTLAVTGSDCGSGGGGTPGGNPSDIQFNDTGAFGGSDNFTYDGGSTVTIGGSNPTTLTGNGNDSTIGGRLYVGGGTIIGGSGGLFELNNGAGGMQFSPIAGGGFSLNGDGLNLNGELIANGGVNAGGYGIEYGDGTFQTTAFVPQSYSGDGLTVTSTVTSTVNGTSTTFSVIPGVYYPVSNPNRFIPLTALSATGTALAYNSSTGVFASTAITTSTYNANFGTAASHPATDFLTNASVTAQLPLVWSNTSTVSCPTCIATNTANWAGTWQNATSGTYYLASNPNSYVSSSVTNGLISYITQGGSTGTVFNWKVATGTMGIATATANGSTTFTVTVPGNLTAYTNGPGYITSAPATSSLVAGGTATGPAITLATSTQSGKYTFACSGSTCTLTVPPASDYLSSSTVVPTNNSQLLNGLSFLTNASITAQLPLVWSSTSTATCPTCIATNTGNWAGTWVNATSGTYYPYSNPLGFTSTTGGPSATGTEATYYVAASNAPQWQKNVANYVCASASDDTCIQAAVTAASSSGGLVMLSQGTFGYQVSGVATSVKEYSNNIVIQGQGDGITNWTSVVSTTPILQVGSYQTAATGQLTNVGITGINFTCANTTSTVACVKFDGLGNGSYITNDTTNYGGYGFQMEDFDRVNVINNIHNNPYIAGEWVEEGLANTYGNVYDEQNTTALVFASTTDVLVSADADQSSPAPIERMTFLNNTWHSNNGVASTTGVLMQIKSLDTTMQNNLFESDTWGVIANAQDDVSFDSNHFTNNNPFSSTSSVDCFQFSNTGYGAGNPDFVLQGTNTFSDCVNLFHNVGSGYPTLILGGSSQNQGNVTNLFANTGGGGWSYVGGTDTNFAGTGTITDALSTSPFSNTFTQNLHVGSTTVSTGNYVVSIEPTNGTGAGYGIQVGTGASDPANATIGNLYADTGQLCANSTSHNTNSVCLNGYGDSYVNQLGGGLAIGTNTTGGTGTGVLWVQGTSTMVGNVVTNVTPNSFVWANASGTLVATTTPTGSGGSNNATGSAGFASVFLTANTLGSSSFYGTSTFSIGTTTNGYPGYLLNLVGGNSSTTGGTQLSLQNTSSNAWSEYTLTEDTGSTSTAFGGFGIVNSAGAAGSENNGDVYIEASTTGGIDVETRNGTVRTFIGGIYGSTTAANDITTVASTGLTVNGNVTSTAFLAVTPTGTASYLSNLNTILTIPQNYATSGCPWNTSIYDFGGCVNAAYMSVSSTASSVVIIAPSLNLYYTTPINFGNLGEYATLMGQGDGTVLNWGTANTCAITVNDSISSSTANHRSNVALENFTMLGSSPSLTNPEKAICMGGSNGAAHQDIQNVTTDYFGIDLSIATNTYDNTIQNSVFKGGGQLVNIAPGSNSGEQIRFIDDFIVDQGNSSASNCFYVSPNGASSLEIIGGSIDDCQLSIGNNVWQTTEIGVAHENKGYATYGKYDYVTVGTSSDFTSIGANYISDATTQGNTPNEYVSFNGSGLTVTGDTAVNNSGNSAVLPANFANTGASAGNVSVSGFNDYANDSVSAFMPGFAATSSADISAASTSMALSINGTTTASGTFTIIGVASTSQLISPSSTFTTSTVKTLLGTTVSSTNLTFTNGTSSGNFQTATLKATGATNLSSTVAVTGAATLQSSITQTGGLASFASTTVTGNATATTFVVTSSSVQLGNLSLGTTTQNTGANIFAAFGTGTSTLMIGATSTATSTYRTGCLVLSGSGVASSTIAWYLDISISGTWQISSSTCL